MWRKSAPNECLLAITGAFALGGGIAKANRLAIHALVDAGYKVTIFALNEAKDAAQAYQSLPRVAAEGFADDKIAFTAKVWQALLQKRYRLVFVDHVNLASMLMPLAFLRLVRYTVRLNGIEVFPPKPDSQGQFGLRYARHSLAISEHTQQTVLEQFPDLDVGVCDLSLEPKEELPETLVSDESNDFTSIGGEAMPLGKQIILHVGRMASDEQYKGQDTLIQAMPLILAEYPDAQLVLIGRGDDSARLLALAHSLPTNVQASIFMPGYVTDEMLDWLYAHCSLFAMPSRGEGFGFVYIEAMCWSKPCLGSRVDSARCIIQDGVTGTLVNDPGSPDEVAQHITALLGQPERARQMGAAGRKRVEVYFTYEHFKTRFLKALQLE